MNDEIGGTGSTTDSFVVELEALLDDAEFTELETALDEFNIFEALGAIRQELHHSNFLAFLLDPSESHMLGDAFLKGFLRKAVRAGAGAPVGLSVVDVDLLDLDDAHVHREWHDIDILVIDRSSKTVLIIENKIDSTQHSSQLERYHAIAQYNFPDHQIVGVYLTPSGLDSDDERYLAVSYNEIAVLLDGLLERNGPVVNQAVALLGSHYVRMLKRHILGKQDISTLCARLYQRHRRALDEIYKTRSDRVASIANLLKTLITSEGGLILDDGDKGYVRFAPSSWDRPDLVDPERTWTSTGRILLFEFENSLKCLKLKLVIGPGPTEVRQRLLDLSHGSSPLLKPATKYLNQKWNSVHSREFVSARLLEEGSDVELRGQIEKQWKYFIERDLREIVGVF